MTVNGISDKTKTFEDVTLVFVGNTDQHFCFSAYPLLSSPQTNALYHAAFEEWASQFTNVKILNDQTRSNEVNAILFFYYYDMIWLLQSRFILFCPLAQ